MWRKSQRHKMLLKMSWLLKWSSVSVRWEFVKPSKHKALDSKNEGERERAAACYHTTVNSSKRYWYGELWNVCISSETLLNIVKILLFHKWVTWGWKKHTTEYLNVITISAKHNTCRMLLWFITAVVRYELDFSHNILYVEELACCTVLHFLDYRSNPEGQLFFC